MGSKQNISIQGNEYELAKVLAKCSTLSDKWKELAYGLKVHEDLYKFEKEESCKLRLLKILTQFVSKNGDSATFEKLIGILQEEEFRSAADSVQVFYETQVTIKMENQTLEINSSWPQQNQFVNNGNQEMCTKHIFDCHRCDWTFSFKRRSPKTETDSG